MKTPEEAADKIARIALALIPVHYPAPQCAVKKVKWNQDVIKIKRLIAEQISAQGMGIKIEL